MCCFLGFFFKICVFLLCCLRESLLHFFFFFIFRSIQGTSVKDSLRLPLPQGDSGSEEGGYSPAGSPRSERVPHRGLVKSTHRALLSSASLLASIGLGRCLDVPPRVPPRTNHPSLGDRTPSEPEISFPKPLHSDPPVVDDLISFSPSELLPRPLLDLVLQYQEGKPLPLTPPPPNPRERSSHRTPHSPWGSSTPQQLEPEWSSSSHAANGEVWAELEHRADRRRRSTQGLHSSQLGQFVFLSLSHLFLGC